MSVPDFAASPKKGKSSCSSDTVITAANSSVLSSEGICSSTDCTGLIPAMPSSEAELEAYEEMYPFCPAKKEP